MGNFVNKNAADTVKNRSLSFDPPNSPAAVHQFLSNYQDKLGVKIEGAFTAPVLKVRQQAPKALDPDSRKAWSFYLFNMQERLKGSEDAHKAREQIEALFKADHLKLSVGKLLDLLPHLMRAEQARLAGANSYVRRWFANEKLALQLAVPHDPDNEDREKETRDREVLGTACMVLSKFSDGQNGEIDTDKIREEAFEIGRSLTREELDALSSARMKLISKARALEKYIGPEAQLLLSLCITSHGKEKSEFLSDPSTKADVALIATALRARTDTDEYQLPTSPRTIAARTPRRNSMPVFYAQETTATSATTSSASRPPTPEKEEEGTRTTPPAKAPPSTPRRQSPESEQNGPLTSPLVAGTVRDITYGRAGGFADNLGEAIDELKNRHKTASETTAAVERPGSTVVGSPFAPTSQAFSTASARDATISTDSSATSISTSQKSSSRKRMNKASRSDAKGPRQNSDGSDASSHRTRTPISSRRVKSMVSAQNPSSSDVDSDDRDALTEARNAARALKADMLRPHSDSAIYKKWEAAERQLSTGLTPESSTAMRRLISYCHEVSLAPGKERESLDRVIRYLRPQIKERRALVAVRDLLLAETRGAAQTTATGSFPELLSLLVFTLDAEQAWRREHKAKSSD
jgi:hypothetical protein